MTPELFQRLVKFIEPFMPDFDRRETWLTEAFYLRDPRPVSQLDCSGSPHTFSVRCIKMLNELGCLQNSDQTQYPFISVLLNALRPQCGVEDQQHVDAFLSSLRNECVDPTARESETPLEQRAPPVTPIQSIETDLKDRTPTIFLSYSHADTEFAQRLIADLQRAGHAVWVDTSSLKGGDEWLRAIAEGITNSYAFVLIATNKSLKELSGCAMRFYGQSSATNA